MSAGELEGAKAPGGLTPATEAASTEAPENMLPLAAPPRRYTMRFAIAYACLGLALLGAIAGFVVLAFHPGHKASAPWSTWKPPTGSTGAMAKEIADHVAQQYRVSATGGQLVAVVPRSASVTSGTTDIAIKAVAIRKVAQSNAGIAIDLNPPEMYQLCGLGTDCSISSGKASTTRGQLVRREALEIALYTFKFIPSIKSIAAFMPPPPGVNQHEMIYFQKNDVAQQLDQPLSRTLSSTPAPLPTDPDLSEKPTIDRLTLPHLYTYELQALQGGGAALILDPAT
jgi:hypothetical protein